MKINLINSPCSCEGNLSDTWYLPLGLVHIASHLEDNDIDVEIIDGVVLGLEETLRRCCADIVGIGFNCFNTDEMETIAEKAKSNGAFTVLGGHAASAIPELLLKQNANIDAVIVGDGEWAMHELVKALSTGTSLAKVPNLVFRSGQTIVHNKRDELPISKLSMPRRIAGGLDPESYVARYSDSCTDPLLPDVRPTNVVTRKGCPRRAVGRGCSFCARVDRKVRTRTPMQAWLEYKYLVEDMGVNYLYEDSDSWISLNWLRELENIWTANGGLDVRFRIYGDIRDINAESVLLLKRLNVDTVLTGIESGDRNVLLENGKDFAWHDIEQACHLLNDAGISMTDAYVLGMATETWESIEKTVRLSKKIRSLCNIKTTYWNIMLPLPGSPSWKMLANSSEKFDELAKSYNMNVNRIRQEFFNCCTNLGPNALESLSNLRADLCKNINMPVGEYIR